MADLTFAQVNELLKYDPETGNLFWRERSPDMFTDGEQSAERHCSWWNSRYSGKDAFTARDRGGYLSGTIFGRAYKAHRVIWLLHSGEWPEDDIDHINGDQTDNRLENLRSVSAAENMKNQRIYSNNTSGVAGVSWDKKRGKWRSHIMSNGHQKSLSRFARLEDAIAVRKTAEIDYGFHKNHGRL